MSQPSKESEALLDEHSKLVCFHPAFAKIAGSMTAGLLLAKAFQWSKSKAAQGRDGWIYKSHVHWEKDTGLSRREQQTARKHLRERGLLEEQDGTLPGRGRIMWYRVNQDELCRRLKAHFASPATRYGGADEADEDEAEAAGAAQAPATASHLPATHESARPLSTKAPDPLHESARPVAPERPTPLIAYTGITSGETTMRTHTHTTAAAAGAPVGDVAPSARVCVSLTFEDYRNFARSTPSFTKPDAWAMKHFALRDADVLVMEWKERRNAPPPPARPPALLNPKDCPDCAGTLYYEPGGRGKGVARCPHEGLYAQLAATAQAHAQTPATPEAGDGVGVLLCDLPAAEFAEMVEAVGSLVEAQGRDAGDVIAGLRVTEADRARLRARFGVSGLEVAQRAGAGK